LLFRNRAAQDNDDTCCIRDVEWRTAEVYDLDNNIQEWKAGLLLLNAVLHPSRPTTGSGHNATTTAHTRDYRENKSFLIGPHVLLRIVVEETANWLSHGNHSVSRGLIALHVILASVSIHSAALETTTQLNHGLEFRSPTIRWKRLESMCMECIALFQRVVVNVLSHETAMAVDDLCLCTDLFCKYVSPAVNTMLFALVEATEIKATSSAAAHALPSQFKIDIIRAGLVSTISTLSYHIGQAIISQLLDKDDGVMESSCRKLSVDILRALYHVSNRIDWVFIHPVRRYCHFRGTDRRSPRDLEDVFEGDECDMDDSRILQHFVDECMHELTPLICTHKDITFKRSDRLHDILHEILCGMQLAWNDMGIAFLASWTLRQDDDTVRFPSVHSFPMTFVLFYPHIITILEFSERHQKHGNIHPSPLDHLFVLAHDMLGELLLRASPTDTVDLACREKQIVDSCGLEGPLSPALLVQLIFNRIMDDSIHHGFSDEKASKLDTLRKVLRLYSPPFQVQCIKTLIHRCPYRILVPIMLDLLHIALNHGTVIQLENEVIGIVLPYIQEMRLYCSSSDVNMLLTNVEVYIAAVALVRLLSLLSIGAGRLLDVHNNSATELCSSVNTDLTTLIANFDIENENFKAYRLYLLQNTLRELMDTLPTQFSN